MASQKKWMQAAVSPATKGALRAQMGVKAGETIPPARLDATISSLRKQAEGDKKLTEEKRTLLRRAVLARTFRAAARKRKS